MPESVSRRPVTTEAHVHLQASSVGICSEQKWQWNSIILPILHIYSTLYQRRYIM
jgi:hypothetical protein